MQTIAILGRQPALGLAELESLYGSNVLQPITHDIVAINQEIPMDDFYRLGSVVKAGRVLDTLNTTDWLKVTRILTKELYGDWQMAVGTKLTLGLSNYGLNATPKHLSATALSLKKEFRNQTDITSVRVVPNKERILSTPQVLHNGLTSPTGLELMLIRRGNETLVVQTNWIQDIDAYRERDQERPMRDARVGMLPPKLAQTIINLSTGPDRPEQGGRILDPFCGTGVVLQEATLMHFDAYGSDLDARMVDYTRKNMRWLHDIGLVNAINKDGSYWEGYFELEEADATNHKWQKAFYNHIACETYLGRPFSAVPDPQVLQQVMHDVNVIHKKFLQNVARQTQSGFRMCIAVPAWHTKSAVKHLPVLDHLEELGYNRMSFVHAKTSDLIYHRENQVVGRELVVLIRK